MKTYPDINEQGEISSFEIDIWRAGPKALSSFIEVQMGAEITNRRKMFSGDEIHFTFKYLEHEFVVWEPFGDNSRYTICASEDSNPAPEVLAKVHNEFLKFKPGISGVITGVLGK